MKLMSNHILPWLQAHYHWQLSLIAFASIAAINKIGKPLGMLVPTFRAAAARNQAAADVKMAKPAYAANQRTNRKWSMLYAVMNFGLVLPFCLTVEPQHWWKMLEDIFIILMFYDFFYYLTHRFLFHDNGFLGGPLLWVHAVHHRQHNPCRQDSSYLHPFETAIGLGLYGASILLLSGFMGPFHVVTVTITFVAFTQINLHNHDLWTNEQFPFKYLSTMSKMHHNHHATFVGGNFATISLFYDWLFGTLDHGTQRTRTKQQEVELSGRSDQYHA
jgi:sterol desaturase/sphingolipid hydroxylase (fatty acid hydroxylase superfamily)